MKQLTDKALMQLKKQDLVNLIIDSEKAEKLTELQIKLSKATKEIERKEDVINNSNKEKAELHQKITVLTNDKQNLQNKYNETYKNLNNLQKANKETKDVLKKYEDTNSLLCLTSTIFPSNSSSLISIIVPSNIDTTSKLLLLV